MKKLIVGLGAVGAVLALPVVKRRMVHKMREHCNQMMEQFTCRSETTGHKPMDSEAMHQEMREHCEQMAAPHEERREPVATA